MIKSIALFAFVTSGGIGVISSASMVFSNIRVEDYSVERSSWSVFVAVLVMAISGLLAWFKD